MGDGAYSSLTVSSSFVGRRGRTNVNSEEERSVRNRRCKTPGCIVVDCDCGMVLEMQFCGSDVILCVKLLLVGEIGDGWFEDMLIW